MAQLKNTSKKLVDGILTIAIDRPAKMNALNSETLDELKALIYEAYDSNDIHGIIITGSGDKVFVAGADINELNGLNELNARKYAENGQEIFSLIENCHKPVIAVVNGYALGGGCELALACHFRIASENALFGQPEVHIGTIPGFGGTQRLTQLIGKGQALEMLMTGDVVDAEKALIIGLVNEVLPSREDALDKASVLLKKIHQNAPTAVGQVINCVNSFYSHDGNGYQTEANNFANCTKTNDFKEGIAAFLEKRDPEFKGQ